MLFIAGFCKMQVVQMQQTEIMQLLLRLQCAYPVEQT